MSRCPGDCRTCSRDQQELTVEADLRAFRVQLRDVRDLERDRRSMVILRLSPRRSTMKLPFYLVLVIPIAAATAQTNNVFPPRYAPIWAGNNGTGTGVSSTSSTSRSQYLMNAPIPVGQVLLGIGFRPFGDDAPTAAFSIDVQASAMSTAVAAGGLSTSYAANVTSDATLVVPRQMINVPAYPANRSPADFINIPFQSPWPFGTVGPNLIIDFERFSSSNSTAGYRADRCFAATTGEAVPFGVGCGSATIGSSSTGSYMPGSTVTITLTGGAAMQPAFLAIGNNCVNFLGIPMPVDLGPLLGLVGCELLVAPLVFSSTMTDGAGAASQAFPLPANAAPGGIAFQWLHVDPAAGNPLSLRLSGGRLVNIGPRTCPEGQYLWNFGTLAPSLLDGGAVMNLITP
jgi:hypothetical protein